jgi:hypothetical protein
VIWAGVLGCLLVSAMAQAYTMVVDGDPSDWAMVPPPTTNFNTGHIGRDLLERGGYTWRDEADDERTDFSSPHDAECDILQVHVTSDSSFLYVGVIFDDLTITSGWNAVQLQIALDTDLLIGSGELWMANFSDTKVDEGARWEYLIYTRFGSGGAAPGIVDSAFIPVEITEAYESLSTIGDCVELAVRWEDIGLPGGPTGPIQFTLAAFHSETTDITRDIAGVSDAIDVVTNYGEPGVSHNTWDELNDGYIGHGVVNYYWKLWFHLDPDIEPLSPILISEVYYDTPEGPNERPYEYIEFHNISSVTINMTNYKFGDTSLVGGSEGMERFAGGTMAPGATMVAGGQATAFYAHYGYNPDWEYDADTDASVPNTVDYTTWANGNIALANAGDQILLLDPVDTVLDVATYESGTYPGVTAHPGVPSGTSIERTPQDQDTDDCSVDFSAATPNPGIYGTPTPAFTPTPTVSPTPPPVPATTPAGLAALLAVFALVLNRRRR